MNAETSRLASLLIEHGVDPLDAEQIATDIYQNESSAMYQAILWSYTKFGNYATHDITKIKEVMATQKVDEFQAVGALNQYHPISLSKIYKAKEHKKPLKSASF